MSRLALVAALLVAPCALAAQGGSASVSAAQTSEQAKQRALEAAWSLDGSSKQTPVQRVVALLGKMKAELEHEAANEAEMYDKQVCWCETNEKEKTKAIADAEAKDIELGAEIESRGARFGELSAKIDILKKQIAKDTAALAEATSIREKEAAEFRQEEKDLVQYITNLKNAVQILSKHQFIQTGGKSSLLQASSASEHSTQTKAL